LRANTGPPLTGIATSLTRGSDQPATQARVASVEQSSTTITSKSMKDCAARLSSVAGNKAAPLYTGMTTLMTGSGLGRTARVIERERSASPSPCTVRL
jgi:hypothetical protein